MALTICCIFDSGPHYRLSIYREMHERFGCSFYFNEQPFNASGIKQISVEELPSSVRTKKLRLFSLGYFQCGVLKKVFSSDILILGGTFSSLSDWLIAIIAKCLGRKVFFWTHGWYGREGRVKAFIKHSFFNLAHGLLLYGDYARDLMLKEGFDGKRLFVVHNSLNHRQQLLIREKLHSSDIYSERFGNDHPVLLFVGRLTPQKKLKQILEAMVVLKKRGTPCNLILVGEGAERAELTSIAERFGLSQSVCFYGATYDESVLAELIYNANVVVSPGNVGLTAVHALTFGTPVVSHGNFPQQMPEFEVIVPGKTGDFFKQDDIESLVSTLVPWLTSSNRESIRKNCFNTIDTQWTPSFQIKVLEKALLT